MQNIIETIKQHLILIIVLPFLFIGFVYAILLVIAGLIT